MISDLAKAQRRKAMLLRLGANRSPSFFAASRLCVKNSSAILPGIAHV
jgi:hypothetical protein